MTDWTWIPFHPWIMLYQRPEDSSTPEKSVLPHKQFDVLAIYTGINDDYILSNPTAMLTVLTDSIWIPFHPRILLYQRPQGSWTHGTSVSLCRKVNVLAIHTRSNHEYALSKPTAMPNSADWLHLATFTPMGDALPRTRRLLDTRKNGFAMKTSECSGNFTG